MSQTTILRPRATTGPVLREADGSTFTFDAMLSEAPSHSAKLTKHPVEDGADIADHYQNEPLGLGLAVAVTNSPLTGNQGPHEPNRDIVMYHELVAIKQRGEPLTIVTGLDVYESMVITRLALTRDPTTGQALLINLDLEEVILTSTKQVDIPPSKKRTKGGRQNASEVHVESTDSRASASEQQNNVVSAAETGPSEDAEAKVMRSKDTVGTAGALHGG